MDWVAYIGTYTGGKSAGIYMAPLLADGRLGTLKLAAKAENPSYLAVSPTGRFLYAVLETGTFGGKANGGVASFAIGKDGVLTQTGAQPSMGRYPCYLSVDPSEKFLFVANYGAGAFADTGRSDAALAVFPLQNGTIAPALSVEIREGHGPHPARQTFPHAHFIDFAPDGQLCAVDLGLDSIFRYQVTGAGALEKISRSRMAAGHGPRHLAFLPQAGAAYVVNELDNSLTLLRTDSQGGYAAEKDYATLPADFLGDNLPAAVKISSDHRLIAVSNRGHDSIVLYQIDDKGLLSSPVFTPCGGKGPRDLVFSPDGCFLYAANEVSHTIAAFAVRDGALAFLGDVAQVGSPVCIKFLHLPD
ncbi:MAG: lactonase family protein [Ethanoligenens sp.]|uniref:lactonase family protein n=1 Tax=Ethanoligenens sp. TaxID=2099655 RepID=UPI0039EBDD9C